MPRAGKVPPSWLFRWPGAALVAYSFTFGQKPVLDSGTAMLPPGFLGTRADILMDLVVCSLVVVLPMMWLARVWARGERYTHHRNLMVSLGSTLAVVVLLFEIDIRMAGGFSELAKHSSYAGTWLMDVSLYVHLVLAITTAVLWGWLLITSWRRFPNPPQPGEFSKTHRKWGPIAMWAMVLTGFTGIELYVISFLA